MSDTTNAASVWAVQSKLLETAEKEHEWGDVMSYTSILIDECNGSRLDEGEDHTFDLGYLKAFEFASRMVNYIPQASISGSFLKRDGSVRLEKSLPSKG